MEEKGWTEYDGGPVQEFHRNASRIRVASNVAAIPEKAFFRCRNLRVVDLSNSPAVEIGRDAFSGCYALKEIDLCNATKIGRSAFFGCEALASVTIPSSVAEVEVDAFDGCKNLVHVELSEGIQRMGVRAFYRCSSLIRINIPSSVVDIELYAFSGCRSLREVELNEGLQKITNAFHNCTSLTRITIPSSVKSGCRGAFWDCNQLREADLREGLQMIGGRMFQMCHSLERITIPSSVALVEDRAFWVCRSLTEVTFLEGVHCVEDGAFRECPTLEHFNIPPAAFVIDIERSTCQLMRSTMPKPQNRTVVASKWLQYRSHRQLAQAEAKMNEILGYRDQTDDEKIDCIRKWFAYYYLLDMSTMLELAIWRCNVDGNEQDADARYASRQNCGGDMNIIIPGVLSFLDGTASARAALDCNDDDDSW